VAAATVGIYGHCCNLQVQQQAAATVLLLLLLLLLALAVTTASAACRSATCAAYCRWDITRHCCAKWMA
jgi:hypothetical protein